MHGGRTVTRESYLELPLFNDIGAFPEFYWSIVVHNIVYAIYRKIVYFAINVILCLYLNYCRVIFRVLDNLLDNFLNNFILFNIHCLSLHFYFRFLALLSSLAFLNVHISSELHYISFLFYFSFIFNMNTICYLHALKEANPRIA